MYIASISRTQSVQGTSKIKAIRDCLKTFYVSLQYGGKIFLTNVKTKKTKVYSVTSTKSKLTVREATAIHDQATQMMYGGDDLSQFGNSTDGDGTDRDSTDGDGTDEDSTDRDSTDEDSTDGDSTDGDGTDEDSTDSEGSELVEEIVETNKMIVQPKKPHEKAPKKAPKQSPKKAPKQEPKKAPKQEPKKAPKTTHANKSKTQSEKKTKAKSDLNNAFLSKPDKSKSFNNNQKSHETQEQQPYWQQQQPQQQQQPSHVQFPQAIGQTPYLGTNYTEMSHADMYNTPATQSSDNSETITGSGYDPNPFLYDKIGKEARNKEEIERAKKYLENIKIP
jgi:hypothetical protein